MKKLNPLATISGLLLTIMGCANAANPAEEASVSDHAQGTTQGLESHGVIDDLLGNACGAYLQSQEATLHSCCGQPGDRGNELGVGKFCFTDAACKHNKEAKSCSSAENAEGDHKSYFCTMPCDPQNSQNTCGAGAACACEESGACGCAPVTCAESTTEGCEDA